MTMPLPSAALSSAAREPWTRILAEAIRDVDSLWAVLDLPLSARAAAREACADFPLLVPRPFYQRMARGDLSDPLLRQVLPRAEEMVPVPGFGTDPVGDAAATCHPGLLHKYHGRALLICSGACVVHCRYCFRRHFPYHQRPRGRRWWAGALELIADDPSIEEIILSGGDPLVLPDAELADLVADCAALPQVLRVRIHSRLPIMIPQRVTDQLLSTLSSPDAQSVVVIHANHAREIDGEVIQALTSLRQAGVSLLNQAVLLAGINDSAEAQVSLSQVLFAAGVVPYYLHLLDAVAGAAHFSVSDEQARAIMDGMHRRCSGYLIPRLVREIPGEVGKRWLWPRSEASPSL